MFRTLRELRAGGKLTGKVSGHEEVEFQLVLLNLFRGVTIWPAPSHVPTAHQLNPTFFPKCPRILFKSAIVESGAVLASRIKAFKGSFM